MQFDITIAGTKIMPRSPSNRKSSTKSDHHNNFTLVKSTTVVRGSPVKHTRGRGCGFGSGFSRLGLDGLGGMGSNLCLTLAPRKHSCVTMIGDFQASEKIKKIMINVKNLT